jgi:hypothetical protein
MQPSRVPSLRFTVAVLFVALITAAAAYQASPASGKGDGLLRSELSLGGRTAILAYASNLEASDPANTSLLSATPSTTARVRLGQLETTGALRIGQIDLGPQPSPQRRPSDAAQQDAARSPQLAADGPQASIAVRYELWLEGTSDGWRIQASDAQEKIVGNIPLVRRPAATATPTLVAALIPEDRTLGHLVLRWGEHEATVDVQFTNPLRRRVEENRGVNVTTKRTHDEDTSVLSRNRLLAQRNETALVLTSGARISISFDRTFGKGERPEGVQSSRGLGVDGPDFANLLRTPDRNIVMLTESSVPRLSIAVPLRFGRTLIPIGNQTVGFPGTYGLWLKRVGAGWHLVFNNEPDVWGSQHDPKLDGAEIEVSHSEGHAGSRPFAIGLMPTGPDRGRLVVLWGPHEWTADFVVGG